MTTNAIYIICEDEKEFGFSYPSEAAGYLNSLKYALKQKRIGESLFSKRDVCGMMEQDTEESDGDPQNRHG